MLTLTLVSFVVCTLCRTSESYNSLHVPSYNFGPEERQACPSKINCIGQKACSSNAQCANKCCIDLVNSLACCYTPQTTAAPGTCPPALDCTGGKSCSVNSQCTPHKCCIDIIHEVACCYNSSAVVTTTTVTADEYCPDLEAAASCLDSTQQNKCLCSLEDPQMYCESNETCCIGANSPDPACYLSTP